MRIHFASREHRDFYHDMMAQSRRQDCYHQAFSMSWALPRRHGRIFDKCLIFSRTALNRKECTAAGRPAVPFVCASWPLICGMVTAQSDRVMNLPQMTCFAVSLRRTSWKALNCVTRSIAGSLLRLRMKKHDNMEGLQ